MRILIGTVSPGAPLWVAIIVELGVILLLVLAVKATSRMSDQGIPLIGGFMKTAAIVTLLISPFTFHSAIRGQFNPVTRNSLQTSFFNKGYSIPLSNLDPLFADVSISHSTVLNLSESFYGTDKSGTPVKCKINGKSQLVNKNIFVVFSCSK